MNLALRYPTHVFLKPTEAYRHEALGAAHARKAGTTKNDVSQERDVAALSDFLCTNGQAVLHRIRYVALLTQIL